MRAWIKSSAKLVPRCLGKAKSKRVLGYDIQQPACVNIWRCICDTFIVYPNNLLSHKMEGKW